VLAELEPVIREQEQMRASSGGEALSDAEAKELLDKMIPLLEQSNPDSLDFVNDLRAIKGSDDMISQLEELDFDLALKSLHELRESL